jgi:hypothetical protein
MLEANAISFNFTGGTYALTFLGTTGYSAKNVDFTGYAGNWTGASTATLYGNLTLSTGMTISVAGAITFASTLGNQTITSNSRTSGFGLIANNTGGIVQLQDAFITDTTKTVTLTAGTLDLNGKSLTAGFFNSNTANTRTIAFGTGSITCNGAAGGTLYNTATVTGLTITGTPVVNISYSGAVASTVFSGAASEANTVSFNFTAGTYTLTFLATSGYTAKNIDFTGYAGTWASTSTVTIYGGIVLSSGMTTTGVDTVITFGSTSATIWPLAGNGKVLSCPVVFNGVGGTWRLQGAISWGRGPTAGVALTHTNGTIDLNGFTFTCPYGYLTAAGTKNITFNGGTIVPTSFNNAAPTGFTTTAGTGTGKISMSGGTFTGGGSTYNCTLSSDSASAMTIVGSNTFTTIANGVQPTSILFTAATTTTVTNWNVSGTAGNLVTIGSVTAASHTLSKASGTVRSNYLSISRSTATGGASWYAGANSTNGGNNSGWIFSNAPQINGNFFFMF